VAHFGLRHARFAPGESVLVRGAAGGIGIMTVQLAARGGAGAVAVTTSSDERADRLRGLGATHALDRSGQGGQDAPAGYDVIIDIVAGPAMPSFFARLNPNGRMVAVGAVAGNPPADFGMELFAAFQKSLSFATFSGNTVTETDRRAVTAELLAAAVRGELRSVVHEVLPLEQVALAHRKMAAGEVFGRIVLTPLPAFVSAGRPSYRSSAALAPASEKISLVTPAATSSNSRFMLAHRGPADPAGRVALVGGSPAPVRDRVFDFSERGRGACPYVTTGADW
jgi:NAD(P)-dependent dehydrogenase (short-subunit alcohol dehydrogenase family)